MLQGVGLTKYFPVSSSWVIGKVQTWLKAVDGVSIHVAEGETLGIVGESGSGKTTLAKLFLLLEKPTAGALLFDGKEVEAFDREDLGRYRRSVQAVFQDPYSSLNPRMRVQDIVAEPLPPEATSRTVARQRVAEVLNLVGLNRQSGSLYPHEFSGGQRQRIAIARALVTYPKCIILDEPVSALDVSIRAQILNLLKDLQERLGLAYVMITHDLAAARYLSTRLAVMYAGKLVETGECDVVYAEPLHPYTQALLSCAALPLHPSVRRQRIILPGEVPNPLRPPSGCRFHPRCPQARPQCQTQEPAWKEVKPGHYTACHLY